MWKILEIEIISAISGLNLCSRMDSRTDGCPNNLEFNLSRG